MQFAKPAYTKGIMAEGALVGFVLGYFATRFGGEGSETVGR